jgi:hypothetical protein
MLLGRSRILYVGPSTLRIAFRRVPRELTAPRRLLSGCQSCSQALATLPTCMAWGWVGLEAVAELPVSSEEGHAFREMLKCRRDDEGRGRTAEADCVPQLAIWWYLKLGTAFPSPLPGPPILRPGPGMWLCRDFLFGTAPIPVNEGVIIWVFT